MSLPDFIRDIQSSGMFSITDDTTDDLTEAYNSRFEVLIEKHAPLQRKSTVFRPRAPRNTAQLREAKHVFQKAERL